MTRSTSQLSSVGAGHGCRVKPSTCSRWLFNLNQSRQFCRAHLWCGGAVAVCGLRASHRPNRMYTARLLRVRRFTGPKAAGECTPMPAAQCADTPRQRHHVRRQPARPFRCPEGALHPPHRLHTGHHPTLTAAGPRDRDRLASPSGRTPGVLPAAAGCAAADDARWRFKRELKIPPSMREGPLGAPGALDPPAPSALLCLRLYMAAKLPGGKFERKAESWV